MTPAQFEEDLKRSRDTVECATGRRVLGYRVARPLFEPSDLWVLDVLARHEYAYDSSIFPRFRSFKSEPWRRFPHPHQAGSRTIWEFPFSTWDWFGYMMPIAGGTYLRQLPQFLMKRGVADWNDEYDVPFLMYFHVWDLDPEQPKISAISPLVRMRAYRNLGKMPSIIQEYLCTYRFGSVIDYLGIKKDTCQVMASPSLESSDVDVADQRRYVRTMPVPLTQNEQRLKPGLTIVIPCFNEQDVLPYLRNTLRSVRQSLAKKYDVQLILVDDGSTDSTWQLMNQLFGAQPDCKLIRQPRNEGVAASILNGIQSAQTELVCSIDCDCTYDPHELEKLVPELTEGVDLVTGSPYHPVGKVFNVPAWRLALSKVASYLYRCVLRQKLHTYTSCFRVYRRSAVVNLNLEEGGFLGIAELLGKLDLSGSRIVECPTTLEVRILGESKMKTARTILGHLYLLGMLLILRMRQDFSTKRTAPVSNDNGPTQESAQPALKG